jgi:hypothetical protein
MATRKTTSVAAKATKAQPVKGVKSEAKQTLKSPLERPKKAVKAPKAPLWVWHGLLDASIEARPLLRVLAKGERTMDYMVQAHHAPLPQQGGVQLTLRLRTQISAQDGPLILAEIHYSGIVNTQLTSGEMAPYYEALYPFARIAILALLGQTGHTPPLPEHFYELNQQ